MPSAVKRRMSREEQKRRTRAALIEAAAALFARDGVENASLDRIAAKAGFTKGAVYAHFADKEDLVFAVVDSLSMTIQLEEAFDVRRPLAEQFYALGVRTAQESRSMSGETWRLAMEILQFAQRNRKARNKWVREQREDREGNGRTLEQIESEAGNVLPMSGRDMLTVLNALAFGLVQEQMMDPEAVPDDLFGRAFALLAGPTTT